MKNEDIFACSASLQKYFDDELNANNNNELHELLTQRIIYLMLNDMEKLLGILYRIDVNEKKVKTAFAQTEPKLIAPAIADLVIQRELEKVESRKKFSKREI